jgi:hypothetical protein
VEHDQELLLSTNTQNLVLLSMAIAVLAASYTVGSVFCDSGVHAIAQLQLYNLVPQQEVRGQV